MNLPQHLVDKMRQLQMLAEAGRRADTLEAVERLLAEDPQHAQVVWTTAQQLIGSGGGLAVEFLLPLNLRLPDNLEIHTALAFAYLARNDVIKSLAHCDVVLHHQPENAAALCARARIMLIIDNEFQLADMGVRLVGINDPQAHFLLRHILIRLYNRGREVDCINIGGGPEFHHGGWTNFDPVGSPFNPCALPLSAATVLPLRDTSVRLAYSSDCLQRHDDQTVDRLLSEMRRVLRRDGFLVLKVPDGERALQAWKGGENNFFLQQCGLEALIHLWPRQQVTPTLSACAAWIFCNFWNRAFGDANARFTVRPENAAPAGYFGPPVLSEEEFQFALGMETPHQISAHLAEAVRQREVIDSYHLNHRNAWGRAEFRALLERHQFSVLSMDKAVICKRFERIPTIGAMFDTSLYCVAMSAS